MCEWGDTVDMLVPVPAALAHDGIARWEWKAVDTCIAPLVKALNDAHIYTASCCCGHGKEDGSIMLQDGRTLIVRPATAGREQ